jgi:uncharacterized protein YmfQ (DUF2313 family)
MTECRDIITTPEAESLALKLGKHLPPGRVTQAVQVVGTNFNKMFLVLAKCLIKLYADINSSFSEAIPSCATRLLPLWEQALGVPDTCSGVSGDLEQRRNRLLVESSLIYATTIPQMQAALDALGFPGIKIYTGVEYYSLVSPLPTPLYSLNYRRWTMVVEYRTPTSPTLLPNTLPYPFGQDSLDLVQCIVRRMAPANVGIVYVNLDTP